MKATRRALPASAAVALCTVVGWSGCGTAHPSGFSGGDDGGGGDLTSSGGGLILGSSGGSDSGGGSGGGGVVLTLTGDGGVVKGSACPGGGFTTISGRIYDPAGKDPLYGAVAYVPSKALSPLKQGVSCDTCNSLFSGAPVAAAQTDATGHFVIQNAPAGANVPLVVQLGKWRRAYTLSNVTACKDNPQADRSLKLPNNHLVGNIPNIAVSTGGADTLECLLSRMGVDPGEYTGGPGGAGRIHIFSGGVTGTFFGITIGASPNTNPAGPVSSASLWDKDADINQYDMVILSCEGSETNMANQQVLWDYAKAGGRVFASHFHYAWFNSGPFGTYTPALATWSAGSNNIGDINGVIQTTLGNGAQFPKGVAMKTWLTTVGALGTGGAPAGELHVVAARHNATVTSANTPSTSWIVPDTAAAQPAGSTLYFSFNTPLGTTSEAQCGRIVYSDLHVGGGSMDQGGVVPTECANADLSPQEKALEFMLFDLSACVVSDSAPPPPLTIVPPQ